MLLRMLNEMYIEKLSNEKICKMNSIIIACFISINMITKIITSVILFENNVPILSILLLLISFYVNGIRFHQSYIFMILIVMITLLISTLRISPQVYVIDYMINFILYGVIFSYTIQFKFKFRDVLKSINYISYFYSIYLIIVVGSKIKSATLDIDFTMDLSYTSAVAIISILMYGFKNCSKKELFVNFISLLVNMDMLFIKSANRGAFLVILSYIILNILCKANTKQNKIFTFNAITIFASILLFNIQKIIGNINTVLIGLNLDIPWIKKIAIQASTGDLTSGRLDMYKQAINIFYQNPILGKGIGYYESLNNGIYVHNLVIDLLLGIGILGTVVVISIIIIGIISLFYNNAQDEHKNIIIFLFCLSIPRLMVSSSIWYNQAFWMYISYQVIYMYKYRRAINY